MNTSTTRKNSRGTHWVYEGPTPDEITISAGFLFAMVLALLSLKFIFISEAQENYKLKFQVTKKCIQNII